MIVMQLNNVTKYFGADIILSKIKLEVHHDDRIAIVGRNGAGKSTLLKIMAGQLSYDEGEIYKPKDLTIGYLDQHTGLNSNQSIWNEMLSVFQPLIELEKDLRKLEMKMADPDLIKDQQAYNQLLSTYDEKQVQFQEQGGFQYEAEIEAVLQGLNFGSFDYSTSINELSGGQKTRLALGKLLLSKPDLLILDEPTNHLDIDTLSWLENYLKNYKGAIVIVSHDRYFIDEICDVVYDLAFQQAKKYNGNYSYFLTQRAEEYALELKRFERQQSEIKRLEEFIQRNIARDSTSKMAKSRRKKLEKMDIIDRPKLDNASLKFSFDINRKSGNDVLKVENLSAKYDESDEPVFQNVSFSVNRGERIAIVGPNGIGKSTLLKALLKKIDYVEGDIQYGTNVEFGYYDQEQSSLNRSKTVLQELWDDYPQMLERDIRTVLGNFLFSGDDVLKTVGLLSGGEKARLLLSKLMLQKANVLIMDEPTNHLDLDSKEVLEAALADFPGTILFVSHDRYFINRIATHVMELNKNGNRIFIGDYDYYVEKLQEENELKLIQIQEQQKRNSNDNDQKRHELNKEQQREIRKLERQLEKVENDIHECEQLIEIEQEKLFDEQYINDYTKLQEINDLIKSYEEQLEALMNEWEEVHNKLEILKNEGTSE